MVPAPERLRASGDFAAVMRGGRRVRHALLTVVARRTDGPTTRIGFATSKRVGGAVERNRLKRQLRVMTQALSWHPGFDVVVIPQPACMSARFDEIARAIETSGERLGVLSSEDA
jgi:ribonuclease P protein component